ncbi:MAG: 7-carboxy-7-deazaguanine synthase QueE [Bacteroidota bacterium]|nr:7-carboxy-7-deazaguanine synthase QueE [Bacteroidota bacterium]
MLTDDTYYVSEYFQSIQGEGNYSGVNSLFIRFQHCNLRCSWCDTKYTWNKHSGVHKLFTQTELKKIITGNMTPNVIFTGGEPTLYRLDQLVVPDKKFHVESNGTIIPNQALNIQMEDGSVFSRMAMDEKVISEFNWVISPKLSNSFQEINEEAIVFWANNDWCIFKFVARNRKDLVEINDFADKYAIARKKLFVGIEGTTLASQIKPELVDDIINFGFNFSPRLHVMIWRNVHGK